MLSNWTASVSPPKKKEAIKNSAQLPIATWNEKQILFPPDSNSVGAFGGPVRLVHLLFRWWPPKASATQSNLNLFFRSPTDDDFASHKCHASPFFVTERKKKMTRNTRRECGSSWTIIEKKISTRYQQEEDDDDTPHLVKCESLSFFPSTLCEKWSEVGNGLILKAWAKTVLEVGFIFSRML